VCDSECEDVMCEGGCNECGAHRVLVVMRGRIVETRGSNKQECLSCDVLFVLEAFETSVISDVDINISNI
jgi:hypothetical protein